MAEFIHQMTVTRNGVGVANAEVIFGPFGVFTADGDGEVEVEVPTWTWADKVLIPVCILDPFDGIAVIMNRILENNGSCGIEMTVHAKYDDPDGWTPPTP